MKKIDKYNFFTPGHSDIQTLKRFFKTFFNEDLSQYTNEQLKNPRNILYFTASGIQLSENPTFFDMDILGFFNKQHYISPTNRLMYLNGYVNINGEDYLYSSDGYLIL